MRVHVLLLPPPAWAVVQRPDFELNMMRGIFHWHGFVI